MKNCYLGIDIGSISTKGVIIDENNKIRLIGNPIHGMEKLYLKVLDKQYREDD